MNVQFGGGFQALEPEEGDEAPVAEPPHAGVLRPAVPGELACAAHRVDQLHCAEPVHCAAGWDYWDFGEIVRSRILYIYGERRAGDPFSFLSLTFSFLSRYSFL